MRKFISNIPAILVATILIAGCETNRKNNNTNVPTTVAVATSVPAGTATATVSAGQGAVGTAIVTAGNGSNATTAPVAVTTTPASAAQSNAEVPSRGVPGIVPSGPAGGWESFDLTLVSSGDLSRMMGQPEIIMSGGTPDSISVKFYDGSSNNWSLGLISGRGPVVRYEAVSSKDRKTWRFYAGANDVTFGIVNGSSAIAYLRFKDIAGGDKVHTDDPDKYYAYGHMYTDSTKSPPVWKTR